MIRIALDIGSRKHRYAMSVDGKIEEDELVNERPVLLAFFKKLAKRDRDVRVVMEQTGVYHWEAALAAHAAGLAGATVLRGFAGYGASRRLHHAGILRLAEDLPLVVEIVDEEARLRAFLPQLAGVVKGPITLERVELLDTSAD